MMREIAKKEYEGNCKVLSQRTDKVDGSEGTTVNFK